ncbi:MAG: ABC transporter substrate-binding protein, partial [Candidatus Atribacteria bacterium]|nr:ABC transporter substrate-binding protein [Candidatus Atribacteria bacterium]
VEGDKVVFHLARPYPPFLSILASNSSWSAILCKKTGIELGCWDGKAEGWWKFHNIKKEESPLYEKENGSGPFILSSWDRAEQKVTLVRNEQYWGTKPKLEKVIIWGVDEWSTRRAMLEAGDADQIYIPQQYIDQLSGLSGIDVKKSPRLFVDTFQFNWNITKGSKFLGSGQMDGNGIPPEFFSDVHLRKAFASCIDYETFTNQIMKGFGIQIPTVVPVGILGYSENLPKYQFNLDTAKEEFQKAFDGKLWENGFKLTIIYNTGNERRQTAAEMLKENIESLNPKFKIDVQSQQWPTILDLYKQGQLPMFGIGWQADFADPHNFIFTYYHSNGAYGSTYGDLYVKFAQENENLDKKIDQAIAETDPTKRQALYEDIQKFVVDNAIGLPLAQVIEPEPMRTWVKDWQFHPIRPGTANYNEIYKQE